MSERNDISNKHSPNRNNLDRFANILKERKSIPVKDLKKTSREDKSQAESLSKNSKSKAIDNSYQSMTRSKKDPSVFNLGNESDNSGNEIYITRRGIKDNSNKTEKSLKVKKIEINKNIIEKKREDEENLRKQRFEEEEEINRMNTIRFVNNIDERLNSSQQLLTNEDNVLKLDNSESEIGNNRLKLNVNTNRIIDLAEKKQSHYSLNKSKEESEDLIHNLKDKNYKDEMTGLLEKSFDQHFNVKKNLDEEDEKVTDLLTELENTEFRKKNQNIFTETDRLKTIDEDQNQSKMIYEDDEEDYSNYYEEMDDKQMHLDGYNRFYKKDFFYDDIFQEKERPAALKIENKDSLLFKSRLMHNYFNEKTNVAFPKLTKISEKEKKCQEILKFEENDIDEKEKFYYDKYCCFNARKRYFKVTSHINKWCRFIVCNPIFENISLAIILINTLLILISDPTQVDSIANVTDSYFLYFYTIEMILKILAFGFILSEGAYIKDMWNIIDFFVVLIGWVSYILEEAMNGSKIQGLSGLRAFRILRPLKTVKSIKGLRSLIVTLIASTLALGDIAIVLFSFFLIFSIAGVQMWQGLFLKRCMSLNLGYFYDLSDYSSMCTYDSDCTKFNTPGNLFICAKSYRNPNNDVTHFDNTLSGLITVFIVATMEGWSDIWNYVSKTFKDQYGINAIIIFLYFFVLLFVGGYYLLNLYLAVIKTKFTHISRENTNKNLYKKKRFFDLIEEKYRIKEIKEKVDKIEPKKNLQLKEDEAIKKLKSQYVFIKKNSADIPIVYNTLTDILSIKTMTPEEQYLLNNKIKLESKNIEIEFEKKEKSIKNLARSQNIMLSSVNSINSVDSTKNILLQNIMIKKRGTTINNNKLVFKIMAQFIQPALDETIKLFQINLKEVRTQNQKRHRQNQDNISYFMKKLIKQQKKEEDKKKFRYQISMKQDISMELEVKKRNRSKNISKNFNHKNSMININNLNSNNKDENINEFKKGFHSKKYSSMISKMMPVQKIGNIEDELSFFSDNTEDDIEEYYTLTTNARNNYTEEAKNKYINKIRNATELKTTADDMTKSNTLIIKKSVLDADQNIVNTVTFKKPSSIMPTIFKHKDDIKMHKKIEEKRKRFNVDEYISQMKPVQINKLGKRKSFLNLLQHVDDTHQLDELTNIKKANDPPSDSINNPDNKSLEISMFNDENLFNQSNSISEMDMIPGILPTEDRFAEEDLDFDEINKKHINNKFTKLVRSSMFDTMKRNTLKLSAEEGEKFFSKVNVNMNNNIVIDMKEPRRGLVRTMTRKFSAKNVASDQMKQDLNRSLKKELKDENDNENSTKIRKLYKTPSVEKNYYKYPVLEVKEVKLGDYEKSNKIDNEIRVKKERIPNHMRDKRKFYNYVNNILDKNFAVNDVFKADYWREDVLGPDQKEIEQLKKPEERNPIYVFNDSKLNLKSYGYQRYRKFEILDEEFIHHNHKLKNLGVKAIEMFPPKSKNFGMIKSEKKKRGELMGLTIKSLSKTSQDFNSSGKRSVSNGSGIHRNKSIINKSSVNSVSHVYLQDMFKVKKGMYDKLHRRLNEFNYKTFSHYFLDDERLLNKINQREEKKSILGEILKKEKTLEVKQQIEKIRVYDIETNSRRYSEWSGQEVLNYNNENHNREDEWNNIIDKIEEFDVILWKEGTCANLFQKFRYGFYIVGDSQIFDLFIISMVILNAVIMALDGNLFDPETLKNIQVSNYAFNAIFIAEFVVKFIGLGPIYYFSDPFTYLDVLIIAFAILDMSASTDTESTTSGSQISSQLSFLRVFRIFRVLRLTKVLRKIKAMRKIIVGIKRSLENVSYIILILLIFILIFQLLGMSLLNANVNYQSFLGSFYVTFQILSVENWNTIAFELMDLNSLSILYLVVWIFMGNYILFNLFISVLLDSFDEDEHSEDDDEEELNDYQRKIRQILPETFDKVEQADKEHKLRQKMKKKGMKRKKKSSESNKENSNSQSVNNSLTNTQSVRNSSANSDTSMESDEADVIDEEDDDDYGDISTSAKILKRWERENELFAKNECEWSLYIFSQTNTFRIWMTKLVEDKKFDRIILVMIVFSTLRLILDTFIEGYDSDFMFDMADIAFTMIFLFEMVSKIIAFGFILENGTYLRDNWNKIDFVIVAVSIIDLQGLIQNYTTDVKGSSLNFLKVLRLLRLLRPLRFISHNVQLKLIITSLFDSIIPILNMLFVVMVVFFVFSIVGMNLFSEIYHTCYMPSEGTSPYVPVVGFTDKLIENNIGEDIVEIEKLCRSLGGQMDASQQFKFTNLFTSLITCYILSNMEGWPDIMNSYRAHSEYMGLFFILYLIVVSYFFMNLFVGIMFNCFNEAWNREKKKGISNNASAEKYWDWLRQIEHVQPESASFKIPESGFRKYVYNIASSKYMENFIMIVIILNMLLMAVSFEGSDDSYNSILDIINLIFTGIFIVECIIKLVAYGPSGYFYYGWNQFDFFVVASSIVDILITYTTESNSSFLKSFQIIRVLRVLRVTRVLRLVKSLKGLEKLLQTLRWSIGALGNIFILLFLIFCIFAIMGCYLYENIKYSDYKDKLTQVNEYFNFDNFYNSFLLCFRTVTGENWPLMMVELQNVDPNAVAPYTAQLYMISMNFVTNVIMLNLFVLVTLQQYDEFNNKKENPIETFNELLESFKKSWNKFSSDNDKGYKIKKNQVHDFLMDLEWSEFSCKKKMEEIKIYVMDLKLLK